MITKRAFLASVAALVCVEATRPARAALPPIPMAQHERCMRMAIARARRNPAYRFGAVIARGATGEVVAEGTNDSRANPTLHGEISCMNDYVARHGNKGWDSMVLYTTGEPCVMCMGALIWAGVGGVVFATSIDGIRRSGIGQIAISAQQVAEAAPFYHGLLLGGVLATETDRMFMERKKD